METSGLGLWNLFSYIGIPLLVGVTLLIIEYRTKWFANRFRDSNKDPLTELLIDEKVTSLANLDNPTGDWMKIAEEIRILLEKNTLEERSGPISLLKIQPSKGQAAKLTFSFWGDDENSNGETEKWLWMAYVTVNKDGRIIDYERNIN